jgi:predicted amidophosphoribosyltransferase
MILATTCAACATPGPQLCHRCRLALACTAPVVTPTGIRTLGAYDGVLHHLVYALKFHNRRHVASLLADQFVGRLSLSADVVTWAPTGAHRAGRRGFDQGELLARQVARRLGVPCRRLLYRDHGPAQTGRSRQQRLDGVSFRGRASLAPHVLVVDDVATTGATLQAAAAALRSAGIAEVTLAAVTTPVHRRVTGPPVGSNTA